jgi:hypothetical protein
MKSIFKFIAIVLLCVGASTAYAAAPTFVTTPASPIASTTAVLNGQWNGNGISPTNVRFEYGTTPALGSTTNYQTMASSTVTSGTFSDSISNLLPSTTYYFRAMGVNTGGVGFAPSTLSFTTKATTIPCRITSFSSNSYTVTSGSSAVLSWTTTGCSSAQISGVGPATPVASGSANTGAISVPTSYTLTAVNGGSMDTRTINITPTSGTTGTGTTTTGSGTGSNSTTCFVASFYPQSASVSYGSATTLYWNLGGNCTNAYISNGVGSIGMSGSYPTGALYSSAYYTLTATDSISGASIINTIFVGVTGANSTGYGTTGYSTTGYSQPCTVTSFSAYPAVIASGQQATLSWTTTGCLNTTVSGGSLYGQYIPTSGSIQTGALAGTTYFTLSANGASGSTSASTSVAVTNSPYPYSYACQSGVYSPNCNTQYSSNFVTTPATNVGATTARMNGLALNTPDGFSAYFEYGTTPALGRATSFQSLGNVTTFNIYSTITTQPNTTYYYRLVTQIIGGPIVRGNILSFTTAPADTIVYVNDTSSSTTNTTTTTTNSNSSNGMSNVSTNGVQVTVTNQGDKVIVDDTAEYTVTYTNGSGKTLKDATLMIVLPQGFALKQTTQGLMLNPTTVSVALGTLVPGQTGSIYLQATVGQNTMIGTTLVTSATLSYTLPSGAHDSAVGYVLNHASANSSFAGFALGTGFFPSTIFGWLITIIIILTIILIARRIAKQKEAGHGHGAHH